MSRPGSVSGAGTATADRNAHAWACMRRDPTYSGELSAHAGPPRFEAADYPLRVLSEADLAGLARIIPSASAAEGLRY